MGGAGSAGGVCHSISYSSSFVAGTSHPSFVLSPVIKGRALESEIRALLLKGAIDPLFAWQQGSLTYILSWAFQLALVGRRCLKVP